MVSQTDGSTDTRNMGGTHSIKTESEASAITPIINEPNPSVPPIRYNPSVPPIRYQSPPVTTDISAPLQIIPQLLENAAEQNSNDRHGCRLLDEHNYTDSQDVRKLSTHHSISFEFTYSEYWRHRWKEKNIVTENFT